jgi:Right handed beta helix region
MINLNILRLFSIAALVVGVSSAAHAQATRTWVSGVGDDANPCSRTAPCKTFAGAISKTAPGGEISVLDPGGFGGVTITKAITINGGGGLVAGVLVSNTNGITVIAGPNDAVILRDLSINGVGTGTNGVRYISGGSLMIDHCRIYGFRGAPGRGIDVALASSGRLKLIDTVIENMSEDGIHMNTTTGTIFAAIDNTRVADCGQDGIEAAANVRGAISHSRVNHIVSTGVKTSGTNSTFNIDDLFVSYCAVGLEASASSSLRVSDSIIAQNGTGLSANGGIIYSFQGNSLIGNATPGTFSTTVQKQ